MKRIIKKTLLIGLMFLSFLITSCKNCNKKSPFLTSEEIKENYRNFDITINFNSIKYRLIKTSNGYYYENESKNEYIYYNKTLNQSYVVDKVNKQKTLMNGNYDFSTHLENVYYILTYHSKKTNIDNFEKTTLTYLNRDVTEYSRKTDKVEERYYIDNELGGCLYFLLDDGDERYICKIDSLTIGNNFLDEFENYTLLEKANIADFKTENEVLTNLNSYDITFKYAEYNYHIIKSEQGFYYSIDNKDKKESRLYDYQDNSWYIINSLEKTKTPIELEDNVNDKEKEIFGYLLTNHIKKVDNNFYQKEGNLYLDTYKTTVYEKTIILADNMYKEEYNVNLEYGICLKIVKNILNVNLVYEVTNISTNGDISEFLEYKLERNQVFQTWPSAHKYLEGLEPLEYGTFYLGYENETGLTIIYNSFNSSFVDSTIEYFKESGYNNIVKEDSGYDTDFKYLYYTYEATTLNNYRLYLEFDGTRSILTFTINEIS